MNIILKTSFLIFFSLFKAGAFAGTVKEVCKQYFSEKSLDVKNDSKISFMTLLPLAYNIKLNKQKMIDAIKVGQAQDNSNELAYEMTIFTIGSYRKIDIDTKLYESNLRSFKKFKEEIKKTLKGLKNVEECETILNTKTKEIDELSELGRYLIENRKTGFQIENNKISQVIYKSLRNKEIFRDQMTINDLSLELSSPSSNALTLVMHSDQDGKLYDSNGNFIPRRLFKNISKSLKLIIIYACHGKKVSEYYELSSLPNKKTKFILFQARRQLLKYFGEVAPAQFFKKFMSAHVPSFSFSRSEVIRNTSAHNCRMEFKISKKTKGERALFLNQTFVGIISKEGNTVELDCSLFKSTNIISMENINIFQDVEKKSIQDSELVQIDLLGLPYPIVPLKNYFTEDGAYIASKANFDIENLDLLYLKQQADAL